MVSKVTEELDNQDAIQLIREIVEFGTVVLSGHAKERMAERGYTMHDVEHILLRGEIARKEFNPEANNWKYTIKGEALEGEGGGVVTAIIRRDALILITVLG